MPESLTFMMGKHPAELPGELLYCKNHMWCRPGADGVHTFGFSAYAVRLMQDVYFLDWQVAAGAAVKQGQQIGHIETSKAVSDLFAPAAGTITAFNQELLQDPSAINVDNHGAGWLFDMTSDAAGTLNTASIYVRLTPIGERARDQFVLMDEVRNNVLPKVTAEGVRTTLQAPGITGGGGGGGGGQAQGDISFVMQGPSLAELELAEPRTAIAGPSGRIRARSFAA